MIIQPIRTGSGIANGSNDDYHAATNNCNNNALHRKVDNRRFKNCCRYQLSSSLVPRDAGACERTAKHDPS